MWVRLGARHSIKKRENFIMSKRKGIKSFLRNPLKSLIDTIIKKPILCVFRFLSKVIEALDFVILEKVGGWIKQGIVFCSNFLSKKIKIRLWTVLFYLLLLTISLIIPYVIEDYEDLPTDAIEKIFPSAEEYSGDQSGIVLLVIFFVIMTLMFAIVSRIIGFVWTVILESSLIVSLLVLSLFGINQALSAYCGTGNETSSETGDETSSETGNETSSAIDDETGVCRYIPNFSEEYFSIGSFQLIFPLIFTIFIPLYTYILRRKRNFIVVRNENFFGLKDDKVVFRFSIANDSKRTRIIKRVFLLVNNKVTFLIKDYEKAMLTLSPKEKSSLEMEAKYFEKEDKFYAIKGNENLTSAYLFFEMLDGYWGRNLKLTSPINKLMFSSYRFKDGFLTPAPKARFSQPLVWNEKKKK